MYVFHFRLLFKIYRDSVCVFLSRSRWVEEVGFSSMVCTFRRLGLSVQQPVSSQACRLHTCGPLRSVVLALTPPMLSPSTHLSSTPTSSSAPLPPPFPPFGLLFVVNVASVKNTHSYYLQLFCYFWQNCPESH